MEPGHDETGNSHPNEETIQEQPQHIEVVENHPEPPAAEANPVASHGSTGPEAPERIPEHQTDVIEEHVAITKNEVVETSPPMEESKQALVHTENEDIEGANHHASAATHSDEIVPSEHHEEASKLVDPVEKEKLVVEQSISPSVEEKVIVEVESGPPAVDSATATTDSKVLAKGDAPLDEPTSKVLENIPSTPSTDIVPSDSGPDLKETGVPDMSSTSEAHKTLMALTDDGGIDTTQTSDIKQALVNAVCMIHSRLSDEVIPSAQYALSKLTTETLPLATKSVLQASLGLLDAVERVVQDILESF
jgi:hypothetical protein